MPLPGFFISLWVGVVFGIAGVCVHANPLSGNVWKNNPSSQNTPSINLYGGRFKNPLPQPLLKPKTSVKKGRLSTGALGQGRSGSLTQAQRQNSGGSGGASQRGASSAGSSASGGRGGSSVNTKQGAENPGAAGLDVDANPPMEDDVEGNEESTPALRDYHFAQAIEAAHTAAATANRQNGWAIKRMVSAARPPTLDQEDVSSEDEEGSDQQPTYYAGMDEPSPEGDESLPSAQAYEEQNTLQKRKARSPKIPQPPTPEEELEAYSQTVSASKASGAYDDSGEDQADARAESARKREAAFNAKRQAMASSSYVASQPPEDAYEEPAQPNTATQKRRYQRQVARQQYDTAPPGGQGSQLRRQREAYAKAQRESDAQEAERAARTGTSSAAKSGGSSAARGGATASPAGKAAGGVASASSSGRSGVSAKGGQGSSSVANKANRESGSASSGSEAALSESKAKGDGQTSQSETKKAPGKNTPPNRDKDKPSGANKASTQASGSSQSRGGKEGGGKEGGGKEGGGKEGGGKEGGGKEGKKGTKAKEASSVSETTPSSDAPKAQEGGQRKVSGAGGAGATQKQDGKGQAKPRAKEASDSSEGEKGRKKDSDTKNKKDPSAKADKNEHAGDAQTGKSASTKPSHPEDSEAYDDEDADADADADADLETDSQDDKNNSEDQDQEDPEEDRGEPESDAESMNEAKGSSDSLDKGIDGRQSRTAKSGGIDSKGQALSPQGAAKANAPTDTQTPEGGRGKGSQAPGDPQAIIDERDEGTAPDEGGEDTAEEDDSESDMAVEENAESDTAIEGDSEKAINEDEEETSEDVSELPKTNLFKDQKIVSHLGSLMAQARPDFSKQGAAAVKDPLMRSPITLEGIETEEDEETDNSEETEGAERKSSFSFLESVDLEKRKRRPSLWERVQDSLQRVQGAMSASGNTEEDLDSEPPSFDDEEDDE